MVDWAKELNKIHEEHSKETGGGSFISSSLDQTQLSEIREQLSTLDRLKQEAISGKFIERQKTNEKQIGSLKSQLSELQKQFGDNNAFSLRKQMYDEFKQIKGLVDKVDRELGNKVENVSRKLYQKVFRLQKRQEEITKKDHLEKHSNIVNSVANLDGRIGVVEKQVRRLRDHSNNSITDVIERQIRQREELEERIKSHVAQKNGGVGDSSVEKRLKAIEKRLDALSELQHTSEEMIHKISHKTTHYESELFKRLACEMETKIDSLQEKGKKEINMIEAEEIRLVDSRLQDFQRKLNRISDIVIHHSKQAHEARQRFEQEILALEEKIKELQRLEPIIVE